MTWCASPSWHHSFKITCTETLINYYTTVQEQHPSLDKSMSYCNCIVCVILLERVSKLSCVLTLSCSRVSMELPTKNIFPWLTLQSGSCPYITVPETLVACSNSVNAFLYFSHESSLFSLWEEQHFSYSGNHTLSSLLIAEAFIWWREAFST